MDGIATQRYPRATTDPTVIGPYDVVLILVKAHQTHWAAKQVRDFIQSQYNESSNSSLITHHSSLAITLQNGVGNRELLAETLGSEHVGQGVTSLGATLLGPGRVRHAGQGATVFGNTPDSKSATALAAIFTAAGLPAETSDDLDALVWGKLLVNVGINALTALLRVPNGLLPQIPQARTLLAQAVQEATAVATARGTVLPYADPVAHTLAIAEATAANHSSMLQDVLRGSPTEISTINGAVVREGRRLGVPTPVNELLTLLVEAIDAGPAA